MTKMPKTPKPTKFQQGDVVRSMHNDRYLYQVIEPQTPGLYKLAVYSVIPGNGGNLKMIGETFDDVRGNVLARATPQEIHKTLNSENGNG